jgi:hypothetical protein
MTNYEKPYRFNIVLNSQQSAAPFINTNDTYYEFNWTNIPQGKYQMQFSWLGENNSDYVANDCPAIFLSMGTVPSVYQANGTTRSNVSTYIGSLRAQTHAAGQVGFYANAQDNPEIYYNNLPTSGPIRVQVFRSDFVTPFTTVTGGLDIADYVMVLTFKKVGDNI